MSLFLIYELCNLLSWFSKTCSPRVFEKDRNVVSVIDTDSLDEKIWLHPMRVKTMPLWIPVQMLYHPPWLVGGGTAICGLYRYLPPWRVWFSSSLLWDRVKNQKVWAQNRVPFSRKLTNWLKILVQTRETLG